MRPSLALTELQVLPMRKLGKRRRGGGGGGGEQKKLKKLKTAEKQKQKEAGSRGDHVERVSRVRSAGSDKEGRSV